jgi:hypothetical protein
MMLIELHFVLMQKIITIPIKNIKIIAINIEVIYIIMNSTIIK